MLVIVWTSRTVDEGLAPSTPPPLYAVGDRPTVGHALDAAVGAGADDLVVVTTDDRVREAVGTAHEGVPVRTVTPDTPAAELWPGATAPDRVAVLDGATVYDPEGIGSLLEVCPAVSAAYTEDESVWTRAGEDLAAVASPGGAFGGADGGTVGAYVSALRSRADLAPARFAYQHDVRRPWEYLAATERALEDLDRALEGEVHESAECRGAVRVEPGATVDAGVVVEGPVLIRAGAHVGPNAYVRGATALGRDVRVGHGVEVKNSVVMAGAAVPHLSYVGDSVVGPDANLGAGTVVANLRHDGAPVRVTHDGERPSTGRRKFGAVVGEGARLGIGTRLNAGVRVAPGATTDPGETLRRDRTGTEQ